MMLHKKSNRTSLLKLLALAPIVGVTLALNARTITDYVYDEPQKQQPMKKGKANATIKTGMNSDIVVLATDAEPAEQTDGKTFKVYGVVKDKEDGSPIIGTIVQIANSNIGTVTDLNGEFAIDVQKGDALVAAYVGYASNAIVVRDPTTKYVFELQKDDSDKVYDVAEEMPEFPGGPQALMKYLHENVCYPKDAFDAGIQGRVIVQFVVDKDGTIRDAKVMRSINPALDAEAQRVIYAMPKWNPGKQNGEAIAMKYTLPITFRLQGDEVDEKPEVRVIKTDENAADPFIILDGNPISSEQMKKIDPSTIANMEILKDQRAIEKYGDKAKNGVIIITTKK